MDHAARRSTSTIAVFGACLLLAAIVALEAGSTLVDRPGASALDTRLEVVPTPSSWTDDEPFGQVLPPSYLRPGSEAAADYVRDVEESPGLVNNVAAQIGAHYRDRGLAGVRFSGEDRLTVFWKGQAPDHVRTTLAGRPHDIDVRLVEGAEYSQQQLEDGLARLRDRIADRRGRYRLGSVWRIVTTEPRTDGSGVAIDVYRKKPTPAAQRRIAELTGVELTDIRFRVVQTTVVLLAHRASVVA